MSVDDRVQFNEHKINQSVALGEDADVMEKSLQLFVAADKYNFPYLWSFLGLPIIQMPSEVMASQEIIWAAKPDVIVETGIARGGSLIFAAAMLQLLGRGKVIGVDIDIRRHNRESIEAHPLSSRIEMIEGSSTSAETLAKVKDLIPAGSSVMVILDSDHSREHVLDELRAYSGLVTKGQYLVVADTILGYLDGDQTPTKRSKIWRRGNEPLAARDAFLAETSRFEIDKVINGKLILSSSPGGYLRCVSD